MNFCVVGNGLDISLGLKTRFSDFRDSALGKAFINELNGFFEKSEIIVDFQEIYDRTGNLVTYEIELNEILKKDLYWNQIEQILGFSWKENTIISRDDIDVFAKENQIAPHYFRRLNDIEYFREIFIEVFENYFTRHLEELIDNRKYEFNEGLIEKDDVILNLNYTDTLSNGKEVHKVHVGTGNALHNIIGSTNDKKNNSRIIDNLTFIDEYDYKTIVIYGWHLHDELGIVDTHIIEKLKKLNPQEIKYINYNLNNASISRTKQFISCNFGAINLEIIDKFYDKDNEKYSIKVVTTDHIQGNNLATGELPF